MNVQENEVCEFCGEIKKWVSSNTFHGDYCVDCLRIARNQEIECLKAIREEIKRRG